MQETDWIRPEFERAALVTVDVQIDTLDGQNFEIPGTTAALPQMAELCAAFRAAELPVVHILRLYRPDGSNAELCRRAAIPAGDEMFLAGSEGRRIAAELLPAGAAEPDDELLLSGAFQTIGPQEWYAYKPRWGAFYNTQLGKHLRAIGVTTVVMAGCNYPNCIRASVYEASERDFRVVAITDGISNFTEHGWQELRGIGINVMSTADCIRALPR